MSFSVPRGGAGPYRNRSLLGIAVITLLGSLAYLLALSWPLLFPPPVFVSAAGPGCNLDDGACTASFDNARSIRFAIASTALHPNTPLQTRVDAVGFDADAVKIGFSGMDMNMGLIRNELNDDGRGSFSGSTILPICVRNSMKWTATVSAQGADGVHRASFNFEVHRP